jgi:hypothetical protein
MIVNVDLRSKGSSPQIDAYDTDQKRNHNIPGFLDFQFLLIRVIRVNLWLVGGVWLMKKAANNFSIARCSELSLALDR